MPDLIIKQRNANWDHNKVLLHNPQDGYMKAMITLSVRKDEEQWQLAELGL